MSLLSGYKLLDLANVGPGARASQILADYGMEVVKVAPVSSRARIEPPHYAYGAGRGSQLLRLDLKSEEGRDVLLALARRADVLIESFRPGVASRMGVGYEAVRESNPGIVYCATSGYGQDGPCAGWAGHDINYLALGGFLACSGRDAAGDPALPGATVADSAGGGMHAALAVMAALLARERGGAGRYLDVAATEGVLNLMSLAVDRYLATGEETVPGSDVLTGRYACYGIYRTRDDKWVSVGAIEPVFFRNLCRELDLAQYGEYQYEDARQEEIREALQTAFRQRDRDDWVERLAPRDTCVAPVLSVEEVGSNEHFQARRLFGTARHSQQGEFAQLAPVLAGCERSRQAVDAMAPGSHAILREAGFESDHIASMMERGVVE